jgi:hypothetical protein
MTSPQRKIRTTFLSAAGPGKPPTDWLVKPGFAACAGAERGKSVPAKAGTAAALESSSRRLTPKKPGFGDMGSSFWTLFVMNGTIPRLVENPGGMKPRRYSFTATF